MMTDLPNLQTDAKSLLDSIEHDLNAIDQAMTNLDRNDKFGQQSATNTISSETKQ